MLFRSIDLNPFNVKIDSETFDPVHKKQITRLESDFDQIEVDSKDILLLKFRNWFLLKKDILLNEYSHSKEELEKCIQKLIEEFSGKLVEDASRAYSKKLLGRLSNPAINIWKKLEMII